MSAAKISIRSHATLYKPSLHGCYGLFSGHTLDSDVTRCQRRAYMVTTVSTQGTWTHCLECFRMHRRLPFVPVWCRSEGARPSL